MTILLSALLYDGKQVRVHFIVDSVRFPVWFVMTVYYKMRQILLQNATAILLQNATEVYYKMHQVFITKCDSFITKCDSYYKYRRFYYKIWQLLQNATFTTNCDSTKIVSKFCKRTCYTCKKRLFCSKKELKLHQDATVCFICGKNFSKVY